ncbi:MAG TPA: hypothetical protein VMV18_15745 [bacterium]|nr:hypothetical protein [bacterium]
MSRRLLAALVACAALCACKSASRGSTTDAPAGSVVGVSGAVTARRVPARSPRALSVNAPVFADDVVTTGSNGGVQIVLSRNHATWTLGPGQSRRVDSSVAWAAPEEAGTDLLLHSAEEKDSTHSAGRHGEHEGVSSGEAAIRGDDATPATGSPLPAATTKSDKKDGKADLADSETEAAAEKAAREAAARDAQLREQERTKSLLGVLEKSHSGSFENVFDSTEGTGDGGGRADAQPSPKQRKVIRLEAIAVMGREAHQSLQVTESSVGPSLDRGEISAALADELSDYVNACFDPPWGIAGNPDHTSMGIVLNVGTAGMASVGTVRWSGADDIAACVKARLAQWHLSRNGRAGRVELVLEIVKIPPPPENRPVEAK